MKKEITYTAIDGRSTGYLGLLGGLGALILLGLLSAHHMETEGHWVTGMTDQIVWGMPHVFAVFLIVAASGALNVASIGSVFNKKLYKPLAPLSALLAIALLVGGLMVLVLDLGRPDRLIVAMTHYNFKSIFAWNIILYNGFLAIVAVYLWFMMEKKMKRYSHYAGYTAFVWRLILTTGTGSIFGWLVARQAYDAAIFAPMFIVMSFSFGLAIYLMVLMAAYKWGERPLGDVVVNRLKNLLGVFAAGVLYFLMVYHLTNLYATEHHGVEGFILAGNNIYSTLFWWVMVVLGNIVPMILLWGFGKSRSAIVAACALIVLGGLATMYVIIIGGQAYPLVLFPGAEVSSSFNDGVVNSYSPTIWEFLLGLGGVAFALALVAVAIKLLRFLPVSLADAEVDPHHGIKADA